MSSFVDNVRKRANSQLDRARMEAEHLFSSNIKSNISEINNKNKIPKIKVNSQVLSSAKQIIELDQKKLKDHLHKKGRVNLLGNQWFMGRSGFEDLRKDSAEKL